MVTQHSPMHSYFDKLTRWRPFRGLYKTTTRDTIVRSAEIEISIIELCKNRTQSRLELTLITAVDLEKTRRSVNLVIKLSKYQFRIWLITLYIGQMGCPKFDFGHMVSTRKFRLVPMWLQLWPTMTSIIRLNSYFSVFMTPFDLRGQTFETFSDVDYNPYHVLKSLQSTIIF